MAEKDLDYSRLREILKQAQSEIKLAYSERSLLYSNAEAALEAVLQELSEREKSLNYIIGISNILIDRTEDLRDKNQDQCLQVQKLELRVGRMQEEIYELETALSNKKKVISEQNESLEKVQGKLKKLSHQKPAHSGSLKRSNTKKEFIDEILQNIHLNRDQSTKRLDGNLYTEEIKQKDVKLYRKKSKLNSIKNTLIDREGRINTLEKEINTLVNKNRQLKSLLKETRDKNTELEEITESLSQSNHRFLNLTKTLESKVQILETVGKGQLSSLKNTNSHEDNFDTLHTLQSELEEIDFNRSEIYEYLQLQTMDSLKIRPDGPAKNSGEEFFRMVLLIQTLQTILLNDNYPDHVYRISSKALYLTAVAQCIPFHKWHGWITSEIKKARQKCA